MAGFNFRIVSIAFMVFLLPVSGPLRADESRCEIQFLEGKPAAAVFTSERSEPYFSRLNRLEIEAKTAGRVEVTDLAAARDAARRLYARSVLPYSAREKAFLSGALENVCRILGNEFGGIVHRRWKLLKTEPYIEGSLPHTREDAIVFSAAQLELMLNRPLPYTEMLLVHEILHVVQRENREMFTDFYRKQWGYRRVESVANVPKALRVQQVINPDGVDYHWLVADPATGAGRWLWPRIVLADNGAEAVQMPRDFRFVALRVRESVDGFRVEDGQGDLSAVTPMAQAPALRQRFPAIELPYHPDEVAADYFGRFYIARRFEGKADIAAMKDRALKQLLGLLGNRF